MTDAIYSIKAGQVQAARQQAQSVQQTNQPVEGASFDQVLQNVRFSNHAQQRLEKRGIELNNESLARLSDAIDIAEQRGGKSSLVLVDDVAFIVDVQDRTVVTAMNKNQRGEGVFTQIDSVVFADPAESAATSSIDISG